MLPRWTSHIKDHPNLNFSEKWQKVGVQVCDNLNSYLLKEATALVFSQFYIIISVDSQRTSMRITWGTLQSKWCDDSWEPPQTDWSKKYLSGNGEQVFRKKKKSLPSDWCSQTTSHLKFATIEKIDVLFNKEDQRRWPRENLYLNQERSPKLL